MNKPDLKSIFDIRDLRPLSDSLSVAIVMSLLIAADIATRLLPHVPNCTSVAASALFAGFILRRRLLAASIPLVALLASDLIIGVYDWRIMAAVYGSLALPALLGRFGRTRHGPLVLGGLALASSLLFFVTSNFTVWLFGGMYSPDARGLIQCYVAALPFLKNTVRGDIAWTMAFFGVWVLSGQLFTALRRSTAVRAVSRASASTFQLEALAKQPEHAWHAP